MVAEPEPDTYFAIKTLEFDAVREQLARHTSFSAGRALALDLRPTPLLEEARRRQAATSEALKLPGLRPGLHLGGVHDVRPLVERARVGGVLGPEELLDVASTVRAARAWRRALGPLRDETPTLLELADVYLGDHPGLVEDIQDAIGEGGEVLDSASPALGRIRTELRGAHDRLVTRLREIMAAPSSPSAPNRAARCPASATTSRQVGQPCSSNPWPRSRWAIVGERCAWTKSAK